MSKQTVFADGMICKRKDNAPDFVVCLGGRFIGIECKAGKGKTTTLQEKNLAQIRSAGGLAIVINEENINELKDELIKTFPP